MLSEEEVAFVKGNGAASRTVSETPQRPRLEIPTKDDDEPTIRFTLDLKKSLHRKLKLAAVQKDIKMAELVRYVLEDYLQDM